MGMKRLFGILLILSFLLPSNVVLAQGTFDDMIDVPMAGPKRKPPMENVFYNVLWGSLVGGMNYMAVSILDDSQEKSVRFSTGNMTEKFIEGATYGGLIGLGLGIYLSMNEVRFDPKRSRIAEYRPERDPNLDLSHMHRIQDEKGYRPLFAYTFHF